MSDRFVPTHDTCERANRDRVTIYRWVKAKVFPAPKKVGPNGNSNMWLESELDDYFSDPEGWIERNKAAVS